MAHTAYLNSWLSVYNDEWCRYPSAQVHEVGHNLGLNHAGETTDTYGDQTGMMGYSYASFTTRMCYNPAKSWQLGWYSMKHEVLDFNQRGGFGGSLVGINDYQHIGASGKYVHLRIPGSTEDLYIGFNRRIGINANTQEGFNMVTVQGQLGNSASFLRAKLGVGGKYVVTDFLNSKDLIIEVTTINLTASPSYADVIVQLEGCPPGACGTECNTPCIFPTAPPTHAPTGTPTTTPTAPPTTEPIVLPTVPPTVPLTPAPTPTIPPTPAPTPKPTPKVMDVFPMEGFESGLGIFKTDGSSAKSTTARAIEGKRSLELKDFKATSLVYTSAAYFVGNYQTLNIDFGYWPLGLKSGDSFFVEVSSNNGASWQTIREFKYGVAWSVDNSSWYSGATQWTNDAQSIQLRIRAVFKSKQKVYIDNVTLRGQ